MLPGAHEWISHLIGLRVVVNHSFIAKLVGVGQGSVVFEAEGGHITMPQRDIRLLCPERDPLGRVVPPPEEFSEP